MTNKNRGHPGEQGFSLAGTMIGILIVGAVTVGGTLLYADYKQDQVAQGRGRQLGASLDQLDRFARKYNAQLSSGTSIPGVANAYAPTTAELQGLGFAAAGFADTSQPGGPIVFQIAREPAGCAAAKCILALRAVTSGSVRVSGAVNAPLAQRIAGYIANGAGWSNLASDATKLGKNGVTIPNPLGNVPAIVAAVAWLGNSQSSQTVPLVYYNYRTSACPAGYSGDQDQQQSVSTDKWGNTTTGAWVTYSDNCVADPPTCSNGATNYPTCTFSSGSGSGGTSGSGSGGTSGSGSGSTTDTGPQTGVCSNGAPDYPTCTPQTGYCSNGATDYPTCTPPPPPTCPNGATDYPTCTPPPPPPCIPGYGSTSAGDVGYCIDCDNVAWVDGPFSANTTSQQRACYLSYGTN